MPSILSISDVYNVISKTTIVAFFLGHCIYSDVSVGFLHHGPIPDEYSTVGKSSRETGQPHPEVTKKKTGTRNYSTLPAFGQICTKPGTVED
jgi:hypothetical protein